jgi:hypothetical protein
MPGSAACRHFSLTAGRAHMQVIRFLFLFAALSAPFQAFACVERAPHIDQHLTYYPIVGDKTSHWPKQLRAATGTVFSFLVPARTKFELIQKGMDSYAQLTALNETGTKNMLAARFLVPAWVEIEHDPKKFQWLHLVASAPGNCELRMQAPGGWSKTVQFTFFYPAQTDQAVRPPEQLTWTEGGRNTVSVDAYSNIEVTVPGKVDDGWDASSAWSSGFNLVRIQQVEKAESGTDDRRESRPEVRLFFARTGSPKQGTMFVRRGRDFFAKTLKFKVQVEPTATVCGP